MREIAPDANLLADLMKWAKAAGADAALLIAAIVPASIWKTSTGRGWTWRGRSLA